MRERLVWADAARTLACGLVVLVHVNIYTRAGLETWWPFGFAGVPMFSVAVPAFLVLSGYFAKSAGTGESVATAGSVRRALRLVVPFLVWNMLTIAALGADGLRMDARTIVLHALTGTWQLYFIFALLQLMLLHRLLGSHASTGRTLGLAIASTMVVYAVSDLVLWRIGGADGGAFELFAEKLFPCWTIFFFSGLWLRHHPKVFDTLTGKWLPALLCALAAAYAIYLLELRLEEWRFDYNPRKQILLGGLPFQLLGSVLALALLRALDRSGRAQGLLARLASAGTDTYGIYLSHAAVLVGLFAAARHLGFTTSRGIETPLLAIATWVLAWGFVRLARWLAPGSLRFALLGESSVHPAH